MVFCRSLMIFDRARRWASTLADLSIFLCLCLTTTAGVAAEPSEPRTPLNLALQWKPQSQFAGFYLARDKGF